jgi:hypothetical protein
VRLTVLGQLRDKPTPLQEENREQEQFKSSPMTCTIHSFALRAKPTQRGRVQVQITGSHSPPPSTRETAPQPRSQLRKTCWTKPERAHQVARVSVDERRQSQQRNKGEKRDSLCFAGRPAKSEAKAWARKAGVDKHDQKAPSQPAAERVSKRALPCADECFQKAEGLVEL